jgi:hypothetical protein
VNPIFNKRLIISIMALGFCSSSWADSPLALPEKSHVCSANGIYCAMSDPAKNITMVTKNGSVPAIWNIPGWHRWVLVSNEGNTVIGYGGLNLLPLEVKLTQPLIVFYKKDRLVNTITLAQLFKNKSQLRPTASHLAWLNTMGFNAQNKLSLELIDSRKIIFDSNTGLAVSEH